MRYEVDAEVDGVLCNWSIDADTREDALFAYNLEATTGMTPAGCQVPEREYRLIDLRVGRTKEELLLELFNDLFAPTSTYVEKFR